MKRPRFFLLLVLILVIINAIFFAAWYGLGGKAWVKSLIENQVGKALAGELSIQNFNLGERQAYMEGISFASADSSMSFDVNKLNVRYNLFAFIFSGFKLRHILDHVEISSAVFNLKVLPSEKAKPPSKFKLPDLSPYFKQIELKDGSVNLDINIALELGDGKMLNINQSLKNIYISAINEDKIKLSLSANIPGEGKLSAEGSLIKDRLEHASAHISNFKPQYIHHPALGYPQAEIDLQLSASQASAHDAILFDGKLLAWDTTALLLKEYPVSLPFLSAEIVKNHLKVAISNSSVGNSRLGGHLEIDDPLGRLHLDSATLNLSLDLSMINSSLSGIVDANLQAQGSIKKPQASFTARSSAINIAGQQIADIFAKGSYSDELINIEELKGQFMDHVLNARGKLDPFALSIKTDFGIAPKSQNQELALNLKAQMDFDLYETLPQVAAQVHSLSIRRANASLNDFSGYVNLVPGIEGIYEGYYLDCELSSPDGQFLSAVGDVLDRSLAVDLDLNTIALAEVYPHELLKRFAPLVQGSVRGFMHKDNIVAHTELFLSTNKEFNYATQLSVSGSYNLNTARAGLYAHATKGSLNGNELNFEVTGKLEDGILSLGSLRVNDLIRATAKIPLDDLMQSSLSFVLNDLSSHEVQSFFPEFTSFLPEVSGLQITGSYNSASPEQIDAIVSVAKVQVEGLKPISAEITLKGPPGKVELMGRIKAGNNGINLKDSQLNLSNGLSMDVKAIAQAFPISDILQDLPLSLSVSGELGFAFGTENSPKPGMLISADLSAPKLSFEGAPELENLRLIASQSDRLLQVDTLYVSSGGIGEVKGSGALDYSIISGNFFEGENQLNLQADISLFEWLKAQIPLIVDASGRSYMSASIGVKEDEFEVSRGNIDIRDGYLLIKDQVEPITSLNMAATITENKLSIDRANLLMGKGRLKFFSEFEDDPSNHFFVGFLDLGILKLGTDEPGLLVNIPFFTAPRTLSSVMIKGRNDAWFTVSGPFDDMKIVGDVSLNDSQALFPPNTDNLLNLVYSFRGALSKPDAGIRASEEAVPLPFSLDLIVHLGDNIRYVTYPANMDIKPGGFLHLVYDGHDWTPKEAIFNSEKGRIDFLGTIFEAEYLNINILDAQDLFNIDGSFTKRSPDGTIITLSVTTDRDLAKDLMERLQFKLSSDNPADQSITDILARLRYSGTSEDLSPGKETLDLQDEALMLLSDNINTSILSPMLYPLENEIRRALKLDGFSIKAGFIQNLFSQYSSNPNQFADHADTNHFLDDVNQFGASILLNNLAITASKYLGRKTFLNYTLTLQEATDLQQRTRILVSHDTSLNLLLPQQFRLGYTLKYEPREENLSHELMLARSFRFWGL